MSFLMNEEEKPFLADDSSTSSASNPQCTRCHRRRRLPTKLVAGGIAAFVVLQVILIGIYTSIFFSLSRYTQSPSDIKPGTASFDIPGIDIQWQKKIFTAFQDSPFTGLPSASTDDAWDQLLENMTIRVTKEELERAEQTSIELPKGGHMAWLGVYHELHCIKYLREWKYKNHYFPNLTEQETLHKSIHADHCVEMLRSAAICRADTSLSTFHWENGPKPMLDLKRPIHTCVDYAAFEASVADRVVSLDELKSMTNPDI